MRARQALAAEAEKYSKLKKEFTELQATACIHESNVKAKQEQVDMLQVRKASIKTCIEREMATIWYFGVLIKVWQQTKPYWSCQDKRLRAKETCIKMCSIVHWFSFCVFCPLCIG